MATIKPIFDLGDGPYHYVFVYGSNLNTQHLDDWCEKNGHRRRLFRPAGVAWMPDTAGAFNAKSVRRKAGVMGLRRQLGNTLPGLLLQTSDEGLRALDSKEGVASGTYKRITRNVIDGEGEIIPVITYVGARDAEEAFFPPSPDYLETILQGYRRLEFDEGPLLAAAAGKRTPSNEDSVFVYGMLLRGEQLAHFVARHNPSCILLAETPGLLVDLGGYPAMLPGDAERGQQTLIQGEFIRFPDVEAALKELDVIEGARPNCVRGDQYRRVLMQVGVGDGKFRLAWTYVMDDEQVLARPIISSGCWRQHQGHREPAIRAIVETHAGKAPDFFKALDSGARYLMAPHVPPAFDLTIEGITKAVMEGELSERKIARCSEAWAVPIPSLHVASA